MVITASENQRNSKVVNNQRYVVAHYSFASTITECRSLQENRFLLIKTLISLQTYMIESITFQS